MKNPLVSQLSDYPWSSYSATVGNTKPVAWLTQGLIFKMLSHKDKHQGYANYVMAGVDDETAKFYSKGNMASVMGDKEFKQWVYEERLPQLAAEQESRVTGADLTMEQVVSSIANEYCVTENDIIKMVRGRQKENEARKLAMYLCQELVAAKLADIAIVFHLSQIGAVSFITHQVRKRAQEDKQFSRRVGI